MNETTEFFLWVVAAIVAVAILIFGIAIGPVKFFNENSCNQTGDEYGLKSDYRFWSNVCYATLPDGRKINIDRLQGFEKGR